MTESWLGSWIWDGGEASPRNAWQCFRRTFRPPPSFDEAELAIAADSRYVLYLNGERVGRGPPRSWPWEQAYDVHRVAHLLRADEDNTIAVLVMHYGVSTFNYVRGRGGLLVQLDLRKQGQPLATVASDSAWRTTPHPGHDRRAPRMSVQLGYSERIDARAWQQDWTTTGFDDNDWGSATEIGPVGMEPWTSLVPSSIPPLRDETIGPERIESLHAVKPVSYTTVIDTCAQMMPDSGDHANAVRYVGYLATVIRLQRSASVVVGSPVADSSGFGECFLNGRPCPAGQTHGTAPERYHRLDLEEGDNLLLIDVSGDDRGGVGLHLVIDSEASFELCSPLDDGAPMWQASAPGQTRAGGQPSPNDLLAGKPRADDLSPFVTIGPFDEGVVIDHKPLPVMDYHHDSFRAVRQAGSVLDLLAFSELMRPVPTALCSRDDVFCACIRTRERTEQPVPPSLQRALLAIDDSGEAPRFDGADCEFVVDFGRETSGFVTFEVDAAAGTILDFYGFEFLDDGRRQDTFGLDNTLRYVCRQGRQRYTSVVRRGLRYLMVVVRTGAGASSASARFSGIDFIESTYPVVDAGRFHCSDPRLERIWEISRRTLKLCMEDTYVDCPAFEQTFWVGDSRNEALLNSYLFGADALTERCLRLVPGSRRHTPFLTDQVPSGWNSVIPNWTFFWVKACLEHYQQTGNERFAADMWPHVRSALAAYLEQLDDHGLFRFHGWNFLDWAPIDQPNDGVVTHQNMFLVEALSAAAELAQAGASGTATTDVARSFEQQAARLTRSINDRLWSEERQAYRDSIHEDGSPSTVFSMQTQVVAYLSGVVGGDRRKRIEGYLVEPPPDFVAIGSPFMSFFHYEALAEIERFDLMIEDIRVNYGRMLDHGATTCWEMYPGSENRANREFLTRSHCHAWSAAPGYFLGAHVLGVRRAAPGWERVIVAPQPCDLAWANGSVPLPSGGRIDVSWQIGDGGLIVDITVPAGVEVEIRLPPGIPSMFPPRVKVAK